MTIKSSTALMTSSVSSCGTFADFTTTSGIMPVGGDTKGPSPRDRESKAAASALRPTLEQGCLNGKISVDESFEPRDGMRRGADLAKLSGVSSVPVLILLHCV